MYGFLRFNSIYWIVVDSIFLLTESLAALLVYSLIPSFKTWIVLEIIKVYCIFHEDHYTLSGKLDDLRALNKHGRFPWSSTSRKSPAGLTFPRPTKAIVLLRKERPQQLEHVVTSSTPCHFSNVMIAIR